MKSVIKFDDHIEIVADDCPINDRLYPCFQVYPTNCGVKVCHAKGEVALKHEDFADQFSTAELMLAWFDTLNACFGCYQESTTVEPPVFNNLEGLSPNKVCYEDGTCGYVAIKVNEDETFLTCFFDEAFQFVGNEAPKEVVECPTYEVITSEKCIE